jgi:hypothetical protein
MLFIWGADLTSELHTIKTITIEIAYSKLKFILDGI